ncbi:hypothetical protein WMF01_12105 [Sorangium sp. So ce1667]
MSELTGNPAVYPDTFEGPDDGDGRDAASHLIAFEALADRTAHLKSRLEGNVEFPADVTLDGTLTASTVTTGSVEAEDMSAGAYLVPERTIERCYEGVGGTDDSWSFQEDGSTANNFHWIATATGTHKLRISFPAESGWTITKVEASVQAQTGHTGLPGTMPTLRLVRRNITGSGAASTSWTGTDPSASTAAYQAVHWIPVTVSGGHVVDATTGIYYCVLTTESGTSELAGLKYFSLRVTYTYTRVDKV